MKPPTLIPELTISLMEVSKLVVRLSPPEMTDTIGIPRDDLPSPKERVEMLSRVWKLCCECAMLAALEEKVAERALGMEDARDG